MNDAQFIWLVVTLGIILGLCVFIALEIGGKK
jgi:hypothetical protein